jgi:hypothetical protein
MRYVDIPTLQLARNRESGVVHLVHKGTARSYPTETHRIWVTELRPLCGGTDAITLTYRNPPNVLDTDLRRHLDMPQGKFSGDPAEITCQRCCDIFMVRFPDQIVGDGLRYFLNAPWTERWDEVTKRQYMIASVKHQPYFTGDRKWYIDHGMPPSSFDTVFCRGRIQYPKEKATWKKESSAKKGKRALFRKTT